MVSGREQYLNHVVEMSVKNKAGEQKVNTVIVIDDSKLPALTEPKSPEYIQAKAEQLFYQQFKSSVCRLNSALHSDYFCNSVDWIENNILPDLNNEQIKSLSFRHDVMDKETGKVVMSRFPAGDDSFLSWSDVLKAKALGQAGFGMEKLVTATRSRATSQPVEIKKIWEN